VREVQKLLRLADLIETRNQEDELISCLIGRPPLRRDLALFLASCIFDIKLELPPSCNQFDGRFRSGPLAEKTVIVQWRPEHDGSIDIKPDYVPDAYLVFVGPRSDPAAPPAARPLVIQEVFVFDGRSLVQGQLARHEPLGPASVVPSRIWDAARVYRTCRWSPLTLSTLQVYILERFGRRAVDDSAASLQLELPV